MSAMDTDHLLRTPLNTILGFSQLLLEETCGPLTERQRQYVGRVQDAGLRLLESVNGLSDLGLIQAGLPTAEIAPGDATRVFSGLMQR